MLGDIKMAEPLCCGLKDSAVEIAKKLRDSHHRHIFVIDKSMFPVGIISTTDMNNKIVAEGADPGSITAAELMSQPIEVYDTGDAADKTYIQMLEKNRMSVAVVRDKKLFGVLTMSRLIGYMTDSGMR